MTSISSMIGQPHDSDPGTEFGQLSLDQLRRLIDKADAAYYRTDLQPILTDEQYDSARAILRAMAPEDPRLARVGVPYSEAELRTKVPHNIPMGSLDNTDNGIVGFPDWYDSMAEKLGVESFPFLASLKIDGASICATYEDGKLTRVATRGNGEVGEDITVNAVNFRGLPTVLSKPLSCDVRGEAVLYKADFKAMEAESAEELSNPRNVGNGILGRDSGKDSDKIQFLAFNIEGVQLVSEVRKFQVMTELGFATTPICICISLSSSSRCTARSRRSVTTCRSRLMASWWSSIRQPINRNS